MRARLVAIGTALCVSATALSTEAFTITQCGEKSFSTEAEAHADCPDDRVVWLDLETNNYHLKGTSAYGNTMPGAFACKQDADDHKAQNGAYSVFLHQLVANFKKVYRRPDGNDNCQPKSQFTLHNGKATKPAPFNSCGPEFDQAFVSAIGTTVLPPTPDGFRDVDVLIVVNMPDAYQYRKFRARVAAK